MIRATHTYAVLEISEAAFQEISQKLRLAGYEHLFGRDGEVDMQGIALKAQTKEQHEPEDQQADSQGR